jgi:hypothetical protein
MQMQPSAVSRSVVTAHAQIAQQHATMQSPDPYMITGAVIGTILGFVYGLKSKDGVGHDLDEWVVGVCTVVGTGIGTLAGVFVYWTMQIGR